MRLVLVRHGQTFANVNGINQGQHPTISPLNELGFEQAREVAKVLSEEKFDKIYSSDLTRAHQTAQEIVKYHEGTDFEVTKGLREVNLGVYNGTKREKLTDIRDTHPFGMWKPEGGETMLDVKDRAREFIEDLYSKHKGENILCVSHGGWISMVLMDLRNLPLTRESYGLVHPGNCSVSVVDYNQSPPLVVIPNRDQ